MSHINIETLTSLAMLKVNADVEGRDYFDYLLPFISHILDKRRPNPVIDLDIKDALREEFGLSVPVHAVGFALNRLVKRTYLEKSNGLYHLTANFKPDDISTRRVAARRMQGTVVNNLAKYAKEKHSLDWSVPTAGDAIVRYLHRFSVECLKTFTQGTALPDVPQVDADLFIVSSFIKDLHALNASLFNDFVALVKGHMLANALLCPDLQSLEKKFSGVTFYLDTPFVMKLFKFWGIPAYEAASELVALLRRLKGKVALFDHTISEIERVLTSCEANIRNPETHSWEMLVSLRREGITASDLAFLRSTLDKEFEKHGIALLNTPGYEKQYNIDEKQLEQVFDSQMHYRTEAAKKADMNSVRSIYALRKNRRPMRLEDSGAVLVTDNDRFARVAFDFGKQHESSREVSAVITDFSLANIAWLKEPMASPDLPRLELLAECYATLEPSPGLWSKYIDQIDALQKRGNISAQEHEVLKLSLTARDELMHLTLGAEAAFSAGTIQAILERVKADLVKEEKAKARKIAHTHEQELRTVRGAEAETKHQLQKFETWNKKLDSRVQRWSAFAGDCAASIMFWSLVLITVAAGIFASAYSPKLRDSMLARIVVNSLLMFALFWSFWNGFNGVTIVDFSRSFGDWVERKIAAALTRFYRP